MSDNHEAQKDELLALASIYDEEEFQRAESGREGEIHLCLELPSDFKLIVKEPTCVEYGISFLPTILSFDLPVDYPSSSAPVFSLSSKWLTGERITTLCKRLDELWEANRGNVVLFTWIQFLKEETLEFLGIHSPLEIQSIAGQSQGESGQTQAAEKSKPQELDPRAVQEVELRTDILSHLLDFDEAQKQKVFDGKVFCCGICFSEKLGSSCLLFKECQHVYCKACMKEYFEIQIRDGKVQCLDCPEPECTSVATPAQVKLLVGEEEFARYDRLLLQSSLDRMEDVVYCPRKSCCTPVMLEPKTSLAICPSCRYAFCTICNRGYHALSQCIATAEEIKRLREEYLAASEIRKKSLEKRFGKHVIQREVENYFSTEWLKDNSKKCPSCGTHVQKDKGCNRMTCTSCWKKFCWVCCTLLSNNNPYNHFSDRNSPCL
ncbi:E3 ubiquitin-protein ligase RNF14-like [Triplophysa rosa]|uniref:E3 ubiquitin-protein ligase RNF14-like n=1 Tax=Triplophysa rosa TaxID=992332 RepID=UPI002545CF10|nr:E3 ubiquitin-protein ligase RNF14-like [Triplophysa rosa]XP_057216010.1 E3 ubiquitin-protein ligase RNF14-like [Triplophysa rosa]